MAVLPARTIRIHGRPRPYLDKRRVRRRDYFLLEPVGSPFRERHLAFDPLAGPRGDFFQIQSLPWNANTEQQLNVVARLKHDAFPRVVEWEPHDAGVDLVLTWIPGISLHKYFEHVRARRRPPLDPGQALRLIHGLASAVCQLHHQCQITHGDIQPANVVLTSHPSRLVLIDFGSAWVQQQAATRGEGDGLLRTYAAPELQTPPYQGGFLADQFSVSVLLFELLTQQLPYQGLGGQAGVAAVTQGQSLGFTPPSQLSPLCRALPGSLRRELDALMQQGLALAAHERFGDRHAWLAKLYEVSTLFRLPPRLSLWERCLARMAQWWVKRVA